MFTENITKFYIRHRNLFGKLSNTEQSGRVEFGFCMVITSISDVLKGTDVLEGTTYAPVTVNPHHHSGKHGTLATAKHQTRSNALHIGDIFRV